MRNNIRIRKNFLLKQSKKSFLKFFFAFFWVFLIIFLIIIFFVNNNQKSNHHQVLKNIQSVKFFGKKIDFSQSDNFFLKKRFEKEVFLITDIVYQYKLWLKRTNLYFPYIEEQLLINWLPNDLKYLPVAESYLKKDAFSHAGAGGIWQFIPSTARENGLVINEYVDERLNYKKATDAAIRYLKKINRKFDWDRLLTMAAYNMWENWLQKRVEEQSEKNYFALWLNEETRRYVFKVMAVKFAYENSHKFWIEIDKDQYYRFPDFSIKEVTKVDDLISFIKENNMTLYQFKQLNPWIKFDKGKLPLRQDWKSRRIRILNN